MRIGWASMGDLLTDPITGTRLTQRERYRMIIDGAVTAEASGFWCASVGEHHFCDYIVSAPPVVLAAIAERTSTIRVGTAVALGANNDPIRLAEDYATLDVISGGRVELVVGRGNLYEHTFTAFGQDPRQSRPLYEERVGLLVEALHGEQLQWAGETRAPFRNFTTQPRAVQERVPVWVGGGSSLDSAEFAARAGLPLMVPGVLGPPRVFVPLVERYRERWAELGHDPEECQVGTIAHTFVGRTSQETFATAAPRFTTYLNWVAELVAISTPSMAGFIKETSLEVLADRGPTVCGSPQQVIDKIGLWRETLDLDVFLAMCDLGGMPPEELHPMLELMGSDVLPVFHAEPAPAA